MICHNCGKNVPMMGRECPYCHAEKKGDKWGTVLGMIGLFIGIIVGIAAFGTFWGVVGCMLLGAMPGAIIQKAYNG